MKVLVDMNLSPRWSAVGAPNAPDEEVLSWAAANGFVLLTHDLDFGAILASSGATIPSVIQIRSDDLRPDVLAGRVASTLALLRQALEEGALVTIDPARERVRILPLSSAP